MAICYLVGAGEGIIPINRKEGDIIIAVDGGLSHLEKLNTPPDLLVGDLDSIGYIPNDVPLIKYPKKKDETDMFLAYYAGVERGFSDFILLGGSGASEDHTFANYALLLKAASAGHNMTLVGECTLATVKKDATVTLQGAAGKRLSIFPFGGNVEIKISGAEYELSEWTTITPDFPLAVSNSFQEKDVSIEVRGAVLIFIER